MSNNNDILGEGINLQHVIELFYDKMIKDDRIRDFFTIVDLEALKRKQANIFASLLSADSRKVQSHLTTIHRPMVEDFGLNDMHYDAFASLLSETLHEQKVDKIIIITLMKNLESLREHILNKE